MYERFSSEKPNVVLIAKVLNKYFIELKKWFTKNLNNISAICTIIVTFPSIYFALRSYEIAAKQEKDTSSIKALEKANILQAESNIQMRKQLENLNKLVELQYKVNTGIEEQVNLNNKQLVISNSISTISQKIEDNKVDECNEQYYFLLEKLRDFDKDEIDTSDYLKTKENLFYLKSIFYQFKKNNILIKDKDFNSICIVILDKISELDENNRRKRKRTLIRNRDKLWTLLEWFPNYSKKYVHIIERQVLESKFKRKSINEKEYLSSKKQIEFELVQLGKNDTFLHHFLINNGYKLVK